MRRLAVATLVALVAFGLYFTTLLPGQDLGDTASFQAIANERHHTPRQAYPLYFAFCAPFVAAMPANPAGATNLASAAAAALAVGAFVLVGAELAGTIVAGVVAALLLAGSYTYWSQAVIAEVYALHALMIALCLLALLWWRRTPSLSRLALFCAVYAVGYGNHLQMVLLLPAFAVYFLASAPGGPGTMLRPRVVILALGIAALAALQYAPTFATLTYLPDNDSWRDLLRTFWFDVTKSDWRRNMVVTIPASMIGDRFAMYWFDVRQQVGLPGVLAAVAGLAFLFRTAWRDGLLLLLAWLVTWLFAFTYNVGDVHVFYLTSHLFVALAAGCGAGLAWHAARWHRFKASRAGAAQHLVPAALAILLASYPVWRVWDTYPAMDRSRDDSPTAFLSWLTQGLDGDHEIFARQINWQLHNGLDYFYRFTRPGLNVLDAGPALLHFPFVVWDNAALGRDVVLTEGAARLVQSAYGGLLPVERDERLAIPTLAQRLGALRPGTPYVLTVMDAYRERPIDWADLEAAARHLGLRTPLPRARFLVVMGTVGAPPILERTGTRPFRVSAPLAGQRVEARIECWLPADTIRRMGFGHVVAGRRHVLAMDRGVSFVALTAEGLPALTAWAGGMYTLQPRFLIRHLPARP